jgi:hypothetical protein
LAVAGAFLDLANAAHPRPAYPRRIRELKTTIHYNNRSGVRAHCPDCHVPHDWTDKVARKMRASMYLGGNRLLGRRGCGGCSACC